jgi:hypothetical protein
MRLNKKRWPVLVGATMTLCVFGVAAAQTGDNTPPPAANVQAPRDVDLPPEQQLALGQQHLGTMTQGAATVRTQLEQARAARDVVKTLCLNDKLNQIDVANRSANDRMTNLTSAVQAKDKDRSRHEFMMIQVLKDRVVQLVKEAAQCIGEEAGFIGESQITLQVDPNIPDNDPNHFGWDPDIISEPPVLSSPTQ